MRLRPRLHSGIPHHDLPQNARYVAWRGSNPSAQFYQHELTLYRLAWAAGPGQAPVSAVSLISHLRRPAPMLMAVEPAP